MIYQNKHRLVRELEKRQKQGEIIHFLTGDGAGDNFFYDIRQGILTCADTLKRYYLIDNHIPMDYFLHIVNADNNMRCYARENGVVSKISFEDMFAPPKIKSPLNLKTSRSAEKENGISKEGESVAQKAGTDVGARIERLSELLRTGNKRVLIFLENLEWIANLYGEQPNHTWIAALKRWEKIRNLQVVVTIKDMALLQKYHFDQEEIFLGNPTAEEIKYSYFRHLLRNTGPDYRFDMETLDDLAHRFSAGKKSLCTCMRILRTVLQEKPAQLCIADFEQGMKKTVEEKVSWENVRLESNIKERIKGAMEAFLADDPSRPPRKGLIFTGPPGTGKTLIAKALANESKCYFMAPTLADLKGEYIGESSAKVKRLFAEARGNAPTLLFIDEADTVFPSRSLGVGDRDNFGLDMVNQFLQELDGTHHGEQKIFTIAATNRFEAVDPAIKSRLSNDPINIPLPSKEMRRLIFDDNLSKGGKIFSLKGKMFEDDVLERSENMSGRDIMNFVKILKEETTELRNDEATAKTFRQLFNKREAAFKEELMDLGIFSRGNIIAPNENNLRLSDIIGYEEIKNKIHLQVDYICASRSQKKRYDDFGIKPRKGILLYGPPGNGKSALAKAVAGEYKFYFFNVVSRDFANSYPEEQIKKLERIFTEVTRFSKLMADYKGIVLFFDEFDSLASSKVLNTVVRGSLLNYIADEEGIRHKDSKILFMAATNSSENIDDAIKRQGRIDTHLFMDYPTETEGKEMLTAFLTRDERVSSLDESFVDLAYTKLRKEKIANETMEYMKKNHNLTVKEQDEKLSFIQNSARPSGAEIEMLCKELKEIAFWHSSPEDKILILNDETLNERFGYDEESGTK